MRQLQFDFKHTGKREPTTSSSAETEPLDTTGPRLDTSSDVPITNDAEQASSELVPLKDQVKDYLAQQPLPVLLYNLRRAFGFIGTEPKDPSSNPVDVAQKELGADVEI